MLRACYMHHVLLALLLVFLSWSDVVNVYWGGTQGFVEFDCIGSLAISRYDTKVSIIKMMIFIQFWTPLKTPKFDPPRGVPRDPPKSGFWPLAPRVVYPRDPPTPPKICNDLHFWHPRAPPKKPTFSTPQKVQKRRSAKPVSVATPRSRTRAVLSMWGLLKNIGEVDKIVPSQPLCSIAMM